MKLVSGVIGIVLIIASTFIVMLSTSEETYIEKKNAMVVKYVEQSNKSLENEDIAGAIKYAKLAIVVDPKNKKGFKAYELAIELKYKPSEEEESYDDSSIQTQPSSDDDEEEAPDMGC